MFKQAFRLTFILIIWKQYKRAIVSTALLFTYLWLVGFAHSEYLSFAKLQPDDANIGLSFFIKWFALIAGIVFFLIFHLFAKPAKKKHKNTVTDDFDVPKTGEPDPFEQIRHKQKLRSRAEMMIEKQKQE